MTDTLSCVEPEGDRAVVGKAYLHIGAESAGFDGCMFLAADLYQSVEVRGCLDSRGAPGNTATRALFRVGSQRELWHEQQATGNIANATIHAAFIISKNTVAE